MTELRQTLRGLARSPAFSVSAVLTLGLAIAAITTVFSIVDAVLLAPPPYASPEQLVVIRSRDARSGVEEGVSAATLRAMRERLGSFSGIEAYTRFGFERGFFITVGESSEAVRQAAVTEGFFDLLGASVRLGRPDGELVIGEELWRRRFAASAAAIGTTIRFEGQRTVELAAVMPRDFALPDVDVWRRVISAESLAAARNDALVFEVIARLKPGVSLAAARAEVEALGRQLASEEPRSDFAGAGAGAAKQGAVEDSGNAHAQLSVAPLQETATRRARPLLLALLVAVVLVLLAACANLTALVLARGVARRPELAVRAALGAPRGRLRLSATSETLAVTTLGAVGGLLGAVWGAAALRLTNAADLPNMTAASVGPPEIGVVLATALLVGIVLGGAAIAALPRDRHAPLGASGAASGAHGGGIARQRAGFGILIAGQTAIAVVLLAAAGLLVQTMARLERVDLGFEPEGVLAVEVRLPISDFGPRFLRTYRAALERVAALAPVGDVGIVDAEPFGGRRWEVRVWESPVAVAGPLGATPDTPPLATTVLRTADAGYFRTMRIPLLRGRGIAVTDTIADEALGGTAPVVGTGVAVVNQSLARRLWPGGDPIGRFIRIDDGLFASLEIVGVVGDTRFGSPAEIPEAEIFIPYAQLPGEAFTLVARAGGAAADPAAIAAIIRAELAALEPDLAVRDVRPLADIVARSTARQRLASRLLSAFALAATLLVVIGVHGVLSFVLSRRMRELGIRTALGASPGRLRGLALRSGLTPVAGGLLAGAMAAAAITRSLSSLLFEVSPTDVPTLLAAAVLLLLGAGAACALPARRAARIDPAAVLRRP